MPQLDTSQYFNIIFWFIINISILFIFVKYFIIPKISNIQNARQTKLISNLEKTLRSEREYKKIYYKLCNNKAETFHNTKILWENIHKKLAFLIKHKNTDSQRYKNKQINLMLEEIRNYNNRFRSIKNNDLTHVVLQFTKLLNFEITTNQIEMYITKHNKNNKE